MWKTLGGLVIEYGGWQWPQAVAGAKRTALKCALMGASYCEQDEWSELHFFRIFRKEYSEIWSKKWNNFVSTYNQQRSGAAVTKPASQEGNPAPVEAVAPPTRLAEATTDPKDNVAGKGKGNKRERSPSRKRSPSNIRKKGGKMGKGSKGCQKVTKTGADAVPVAEDTVKSACKFKIAYQKTMSDAQTTISAIETSKKGERYWWARNDENLGEIQKLRTMIAALENSDMQTFLMHDHNALKKGHVLASIQSMADKLLTTKDHISSLRAKVDEVIFRSTVPNQKVTVPKKAKRSTGKASENMREAD